MVGRMVEAVSSGGELCQMDKKKRELESRVPKSHVDGKALKSRNSRHRLFLADRGQH
jgi:hypothetical protein